MVVCTLGTFFVLFMLSANFWCKLIVEFWYMRTFRTSAITVQQIKLRINRHATPQIRNRENQRLDGVRLPSLIAHSINHPTYLNTTEKCSRAVCILFSSADMFEWYVLESDKFCFNPITFFVLGQNGPNIILNILVEIVYQKLSVVPSHLDSNREFSHITAKNMIGLYMCNTVSKIKNFCAFPPPCISEFVCLFIYF
jgi:hypothetical protein